VCQQIQIRDYNPDDIKSIGKIKQPGMTADRLKEMAYTNYQLGPAKTLFIEDKILACGGFRILWPGVADVWTVVSDDIDSYKNSLIKTYWLCIGEWIEQYDIQRVQCLVESTYEDGKRLAEYLGMKPEGLLRKYCDNKDYIFYAWVK
jgi:hypothetical protein